MSEWNKKRKVMHAYDLTAHIYDVRYAEEQARKIEAALGSINIEKTDIILDVGCGTGLLFNHVANKAKAIVGLDVSKAMLLQVRKSQDFRRLHLILADADSIPIKDTVFSHVFAVTLLQNMPNPIATLEEIKRVSSKDVEIVVTGMKKAFTAKKFKELLETAELEIAFLKSDGLKCYVALCTKARKNSTTPIDLV